MTATEEELLERPHPGVGGIPDEHRSAEPERQKAEAPEGERAEDAAAELDLRDHERAEPLGAKEDRLDGAAGLDVEERESAGELTHLGDGVTAALTVPDGDAAAEGVPAAELHPPGEKNEHPGALLADLEEHRSVGERAALSEPRDPWDVRLGQRVEDLVELSLIHI